MRSRLMARVAALESPVSVAILLIVSSLQILSSPSWIFTPDGNDQWIYHGYFIHLKHHLAEFNGLYYGTRLPWIFLGAFVHSLFAPLIANAVLRFLVYWTALLSAFFIIRRNYGNRCALFIGLLFCASPDALSAIGWDYVDGAGIAFSLLGFCLLAHASARSGIWAVALAAIGGMAFGAAIHSNLFLLILGLPILVFLLGHAERRAPNLAMAVTLGVLLITALIGIASLTAGGRFLFFLPSLNAGAGLLKTNPFFVSPSIWLSKAWWLVIPVAIILAAGVARLRSLRNVSTSPLARIRTADALCGLFVLALFVFLNVLGSPVLQLSFYTSYLSMFIPLAIGAMVATGFDPWPSGRFLKLAGCIVAVDLLVGADTARWLPGLVAWVYQFVETKPDFPPPIWAAILFTALLVVLFQKQRIIMVLSGFAIAFVILHVAHITLREEIPAAESRDRYLDVDHISRELAQITDGAPLWFWCKYRPVGEQHYTSIAFTYLWAFSLIGQNLPDLSDAHLDRLKRGAYLAIMDSNDTVREQAMTVLKAHGLAFEPVDQVTSTIGGQRFVVSLVRISSVDLPPTVSGAPPNSALTSDGDILDESQADLLMHCEHSAYGKKDPAAAATPAGIERITDPRDHFATHFLELKQFNSIAAVEIDLRAAHSSGSFGPVNVICQDQDYKTLYASGTIPSGEARTIVGILPGTRAIRLAFLPNDDGYIRFPDHVRIQALAPK